MELNEAFDERMDKGKSHIREHEARKLHWKISSECISDGLSVPQMIHNWLFPAYAENNQYVCTVLTQEYLLFIYLNIKSKNKEWWLKICRYLPG